MSSREMWEVAWASTRASDVWMFVVALVLLIAGVCIYYATGGDKED